MLFITARCGTSPAIIDYDSHLQGNFNNTTVTDCPITETSQVTTGENSTGIAFSA